MPPLAIPAKRVDDSGTSSAARVSDGCASLPAESRQDRAQHPVVAGPRSWLCLKPQDLNAAFGGVEAGDYGETAHRLHRGWIRHLRGHARECDACATKAPVRGWLVENCASPGALDPERAASGGTSRRGNYSDEQPSQ